MTFIFMCIYMPWQRPILAWAALLGTTSYPRCISMFDGRGPFLHSLCHLQLLAGKSQHPTVCTTSESFHIFPVTILFFNMPMTCYDPSVISLPRLCRRTQCRSGMGSRQKWSRLCRRPVLHSFVEISFRFIFGFHGLKIRTFLWSDGPCGRVRLVAILQCVWPNHHFYSMGVHSSTLWIQVGFGKHFGCNSDWRHSVSRIR